MLTLPPDTNSLVFPGVMNDRSQSIFFLLTTFFIIFS